MKKAPGGPQQDHLDVVDGVNVNVGPRLQGESVTEPSTGSLGLCEAEAKQGETSGAVEEDSARLQVIDAPSVFLPRGCV